MRATGREVDVMPEHLHRNRVLVRTYQLLALLRSGGGCTLDRLASELAVTSRTVRRDLEALQEAGVAIYDDKPDDVRRWRLVKGAPCPLCGRAPLKGDQLRRELAAVRGLVDQSEALDAVGGSTRA
jgi:DNA-binding transcriptional ArsR family regulator